MNIKNFEQKLSNHEFDNILTLLYGNQEDVLATQTKRYQNALSAFHSFFPEKDDVKMFSASGRTEIGGNHTDHQHGVVLGGAVNLDAICVVSFHEEGIVRINSEGYAPLELAVNNLKPENGDSGTASILKGVLFKYAEKNVKVGGFDMYCSSDVINGGGVSSSAAFEVLICTIINSHYYQNKSDALEIAKISQFTENVYFGKKSGLLDQTISAVGGLVSVDFKDNKNPSIEKIDLRFEDFGYTLCVVDTKSSHENLSDQYDAITDEMRDVATYFGKTVLGDVEKDAFYEAIPLLRATCSERAILRAMHFFDETERARLEAYALKAKDIERFLALVNESGDSSSMLLQNLYSCNTPTQQEISLAIAYSKKVLNGKGAVRVHGGGFAGTIQAFVPTNMVNIYALEMEKLFGEHSCIPLSIRPVGGIEIK